MNRTLVTMALVLAAPVHATDCAHRKTIEHEVPVVGLQRVDITAFAGELEVNGTPSASHVRVIGVACTDEAENLEHMDVRVEAHDDELEIRVAIDDRIEPGWTTRYAYIDLVIDLPTDLATAVKDSSGSMTLSDVALTRVRDSSGKIRIRSPQRDFELEDSSGEISVRDARGGITITDSSGGIDLKGVAGTVTVERDSSGNIDISRVGGDVIIERDGSGGIDIDDVEGSVHIGSDGSGGIDIRDVRQDVRIDNDGSGGVYVANVTGDFHLDSKGSGSVRSRHIGGETTTPE